MAKVRRIVATLFAGSLFLLVPATAQAASAETIGDPPVLLQECAENDVCFWERPIFTSRHYVETNLNTTICHPLPWGARSASNSTSYDLLMFDDYDCEGSPVGILESDTSQQIVYPHVRSYLLLS